MRRDETGRTKHDVAEHLVVGHLDVADGDTQAENLLELELDGRADLSELVLEVLGVRDGRRELAGYTPIRHLIRITNANKDGTYPWRDQDRADAGSA